MAAYVESLNRFLSFFTLAAQAGIVFLVASVAAKRKTVLVDLVVEYAEWIALAVAIAGTVASLFYSEIAGFAPCDLCWWQRIFLYPQIIILALALFTKDKEAGKYVVALSAFGMCIAAYNHYLQFAGDATAPCGAGAVSCAKRYVYEFGYITMPLMAFTAFAVNALVLLVRYMIKKSTLHHDGR